MDYHLNRNQSKYITFLISTQIRGTNQWISCDCPSYHFSPGNHCHGFLSPDGRRAAGDSNHYKKC